MDGGSLATTAGALEEDCSEGMVLGGVDEPRPVLTVEEDWLEAVSVSGG